MKVVGPNLADLERRILSWLLPQAAESVDMGDVTLMGTSGGVPPVVSCEPGCPVLVCPVSDCDAVLRRGSSDMSWKREEGREEK